MTQGRSCLTCGTSFEAQAGSSRRYCSPKCWPGANDHSRRPKGGVEVECARCGTTFERKAWEVEQRKRKGWAMYCSVECRDAVKRGRKGQDRVALITLTCPKCGNGFEVKPHEQRRRRYCSTDCARWTGGRLPEPKKRTLTVDGYVNVYLPPGERPPGQERYTRFAEHRVVMARVLGRWLERHEVVHHINGDRSDNRPENLQLRTIKQHGHGQVMRCRSCGSHDIEHVEF